MPGLIAALLLAARIGAAAEPALAADATLSALEGEVFVRPDGLKEEVAAAPGNGLILGDRVRTGTAARAHIVFDDGAALLLRENTQVTLGGSPSHRDVKVRAGEFLLGLAKKLGLGSTFRITTPSAVAAVRGTLVWGKVDATKSSVFAGFSGTVTISAKGRRVVLRPGQVITVPFGKAPSAPQPREVGPEYLDNFTVGESLQGVEGLIEK
jgi:hypothetical protein